MREEFYRIKRLPPYIFSEINNLKADLRKKNVDIIDFGMGNPDIDAGKHIINKLIETSKKPKVHRYSASRGIPGLRKAKARYYENRFGVALDPENEIITTLGSKEGLANLASAITAPGDLVLVPNPTYPIHAYGFMIAGAKRIGHGIDIAYEDDLNELLEHMAKHSIAVEINLTSNDVILGISGAEHPFKTYMEYGVPLTISTDDEGVSRIDLTNEYSRAVTEYDLDYKTIRSLSRNAIQYSFLQGAPLFKDTLTGEVIDECSEDKNTDEEILTDRCEHFLSTSSKARMQWQLEQKISLFEQAVRI